MGLIKARKRSSLQTLQCRVTVQIMVGDSADALAAFVRHIQSDRNRGSYHMRPIEGQSLHRVKHLGFLHVGIHSSLPDAAMARSMAAV
jgi:hypothetical protein